MPSSPKKHNRPWVKVRKQQERLIDMSWFYNDGRWRRFSKAYKLRYPLCIDCEREGLVTPSKVTDHIVRFVDGGKGFDLDNLKDEYFQPQCDKHHNSKSGRESKGYRRGMG